MPNRGTLTRKSYSSLNRINSICAQRITETAGKYRSQKLALCRSESNTKRCRWIYGLQLESSHIAIFKDAEAVLRLMNSTGRVMVSSLLRSTAAMMLCSRVSNSSDLILDFSSSVRARVRCRSSLEFSSAILSQ